MIPLKGNILQDIFKKAVFLPWRIIIPIFLALSAVGYGIYGWDLSQSLCSRTTQGEAERMVEDMKRSNPALAADITRLQNEFGTVALATKMSLDAQVINQSISKKLLLDYLKEGTVPPELTLVKLTSTTHLLYDKQAQWTFLTEYYNPFVDSFDDETRNQLAAALTAASQSPSDWKIVSQHPASILVWQATRNEPNLWDFYSRNHQWLAGPLLIAFNFDTDEIEDVGGGNQEDDSFMRIRQLLFVAQKYQKILMDIQKLYTKEENIAQSLILLELHGETIRIAQERHGIPTAETIEVLYANPDYFPIQDDQSHNVVSPGERNASKLAAIWREHRVVWNYAKVVPLALKFYNDAPQNADKVLEKYGNNASFLFQLYENYGIEDEYGNSRTMAFVGDAIAKFEDLAVYILFEYKDNNDFKELLVNPDVGSRLIPYVARFPDGLSKLKNDTQWINRYFDEEGKAIDDERWWEALPGGSIVKVIKNKMIDGVPCTWGELGWGVFDTVDVALIAITLGTGKTITSSAKSILKGGARAADKVGDAMRWLRRSQKAERMSEASRIVRGGARSGSLLAQHGSETVYKRILRGAEELGDKIKKLSDPKYKKVCLSVGFTLAVTKLYARSDAIKKAPKQIGELLGEFLSGASTAPGEMLASTFQKLLESAGLSWVTPVFHVTVVLLLLGASYGAWVGMKPRNVRYV